MSQIHGLSDVTKRLSHIESLLDIKIDTLTKPHKPHCVTCCVTCEMDLELSNLKERMIIIEEQLSTINSTLMKLKRDIKK